MTKNVIIGLLVAVCIIALIYGQYQNVLEDRAALEASAQREKAEKALNDLKKGR